MVNKKLSMVVIAIVLLFTTVFSPVAQAESNSLTDVLTTSITSNDGLNIELKQLNTSNTSMEFTVKGNEINEHVVVNYDTQEFTITDKDGKIVTYNANDFVVNSGVNESVNEAPVEESINQLADDGSKRTCTTL